MAAHAAPAAGQHDEDHDGPDAAFEKTQKLAKTIATWGIRILLAGIVILAILFGVKSCDDKSAEMKAKKESGGTQQTSQEGSTTVTTTTRPSVPVRPAVSLDAKPLMVPGASSNDWSEAVDRPDGHTVKLCNGTTDKVRVQHRFKYQSTWTDLEPGTRASFEQFRLQALGPDAFEGCYRFTPSA